MDITPGSGATIAATTLEQLTYSLLRFGQNNEGNPDRNPTGNNYITSNHNDDSQIFSATAAIPLNALTFDASGKVIVSANDYLTGVTFAAGSGGTLKSANWVQMLVESTVYQWQQEINTAKNPEARFAISWSFQGSTTGAIFNGSYSLPTTMTMSADGSWCVKALEYLV